MRIQKAARNESEGTKSRKALTVDECLVWKELEDLVSSPTRKVASQLYVHRVISPLLGSKYVDAGVCPYYKLLCNTLCSISPNFVYYYFNFALVDSSF